MTGPLILLMFPVYMGFLLWVGRRAEAKPLGSARYGAIVYSLSLAVYCSSWMFFTSVGVLARYGWAFINTFIGPIICIVVFFPVWRRIAHLVKRENIGSIADFLASRYGKSRGLGALVSCVCLMAGLPFMAIQMRAISESWTVATGEGGTAGIVVLLLAAIVAVFAILFGAKRPVVTEHSRDLVAVLALESVVKLAIILAVSILCLIVLIRSDHGWSAAGKFYALPLTDGSFIATTIMAGANFMILPRQFYLSFVELNREKDLQTARWLVPLYLAIACLALVPITAAGAQMFPGMVQATDMYAMLLPAKFGGTVFVAVAFLGGVTCAAALIMVESITLSSMISNTVFFPILAKSGWDMNKRDDLGPTILGVRRFAIVAIIVFGWCTFQAFDKNLMFSNMDNVASSCLVQLLPSVIGALYWRRANVNGAFAGIAGGSLYWIFNVALPRFSKQFHAIDYGVSLAGTHGASLYTEQIIASLTINTVLFLGASLLSKQRLIDRVQASAFCSGGAGIGSVVASSIPRGNVGDLKDFVARFLGRQEADQIFSDLASRNGPLQDDYDLTQNIMLDAERSLTGAIGPALAQKLMAARFYGDEAESAFGAGFDEYAQAVQFNRELLQTTMNNLEQGVCVLDGNGCILAWNRRYIELLGFPDDFIRVGVFIGKAIEFSERRAGRSNKATAAIIERRLLHVRLGILDVKEKTYGRNLILNIVGHPMSGGRYVLTFSDVTQLRQATAALKTANEGLESRVQARTTELKSANIRLEKANAQAERARNSQAMFLAAASHDLLQPLHAAHLFLESLEQELAPRQESARRYANKAGFSIETANRLLRALLNLSRHDVNGVDPELHAVNIGALLHELRQEFEPIARARNVTIRFAPAEGFVLTDAMLLRSVLQNLIGNAVHYTPNGRVLVVCRRESDGVRFEVRDNGPGISEAALKAIFKEFSRASQGGDGGAGLGLSIADRICKLLGHSLRVVSRIGSGSIFSVTVSRAHPSEIEEAAPIPGYLPPGLRVLCIQSEHSAFENIATLLERWNAKITLAGSVSEAIALPEEWDAALVDVQQHQGGMDGSILEAIRDRAKTVAIITNYCDEQFTEEAAHLNLELIFKPVSAAALRSFLSRAWRFGPAKSF